MSIRKTLPNLSFFLAILTLGLLLLGGQLQAQDLCANAVALCNSNKITATTAGATASPTDPPLACGDMIVNNSVWFLVQGISNGSASITISKIDNIPGLEMAVFSGSCGALTPLGQCTSAVGPNASMSLTFPVAAGVNYYIMVDGTGGNQEAFDILATSAGNNILAKPDPNFNTNPSSGCDPLTVFLQNTTLINGGTNITYQWRIDGTAYPSSGADTTITLTGMGIHAVELRVCNNECGCKTIVQDVVVQDLVPAISYNPVVTCLGTPVTFMGSASIQPDPPFVVPVITSWFWNFGDPASGVNNTSTQQNPTHTFVGPGTSFTVKLVIDGTCGPDSTTLLVNLLPPPVVNAGANQVVCTGAPVNLNATVSNATLPIMSYQWTGPGTFSCSTCPATSVSGLAPGGPYNFTMSIVDANGCVGTGVTQVTVNPIPVVNAGMDAQVCRWIPYTLTPTVTLGNGPFTYAWSPSTGLNNSNIQNPTATVIAPATYCVTVTDNAGCVSAPDCVDLTIFPPPTLNSASTSICATASPPLQNTFTVTGAGTGSTYSWTLSPNYSLITSANGDSSSVTATFPATPASYAFISIVTDGVTGCKDTLSAMFTVDPPPTLSVNGPFTICIGGSATLTASGSGTYNWTSSPAYALADPTLPSQAVSPTVTTFFYVQSTNGSCVAYDTVRVTVNPIPIVSAGMDAQVCRWMPYTLTPTVSVGNGPFTYSWSPSTGLNNSNIQNPSATITAPATYCVTVSDNAGCVSAPDCVDLTIFPPPTLNSASTTVCASASPPLQNTFNVSGAGAGSSYSWTLSPNYSLITSANGDSSAVTATFPATPATYTFMVIVTDGVTSCKDTLSATFTVAPPPPLVVNGPFTICQGQSAALTASGGSAYNWTSSPAYIFADPTLANQTVNPTTTTFFYVQATNGTCFAYDTIRVTVNPIPVAIAAAIPNICGCASVNLDGTGSTPGMQYNWTTSGAGTISSPTSLVTTAVACAGQTFTLTVTDPITGCMNTAVQGVVQRPKPAAAAQASPSQLCSGTPTLITLTGTGSNTATGTTYQWTAVPPVAITNATTLNASATISVSTVFTLSVTDSAGCDSSATATVNTFVPPAIAASPNSLCTLDTSLVSTITITGAGGGSTYNWIQIPACANPNTASTASQSFNFAACGAGNLQFTVVVNNASTGCIDTLNLTIPIAAGVVLTVSTDTTICQGSNLTLTASGASNYTWSGGQTTASIVVSPPLAASATPYTFTVTGSSGSCADTKTISITVNPIPPPITITGPANLCAGATGSAYSVPNTPGSTYAWTVSGGSLSGGQGTSSITVNWPTAGAGTVNVTQTNAGGCPGPPASINVTVNSLPVTSAINGPAGACVGVSGVVYNVSATAGSTYNWTISGGAINSGQSTNTVSVTWNTAGSGTLTVVETGANGCPGAPQMINVTVSPIPVTSAITGPANHCQGATGTIYSVINNAGSVYTWTVTGGNLASGQGTNVISTNWPTAGGGNVSVTQVSAAGCIAAPVNLPVNVVLPPTASATASADSLCQGQSVNLTGTFANGTITWTTNGSGTFSNPNAPSPVYSAGTTGTGNVTLTMTVSNPPCANAVATINIYVKPTPVNPVITGPASICEGTAGVVYTLQTPVTAGTQWAVAGGTLLSGQGTSNISVNWGATGTGSVTVTDVNSFGCAATPANIMVQINPIPANSVVSGNTNVCAGQSGVNYSVPPTAGITYAWGIIGGSIVSGQGSPAISVTWGAAGAGTITLLETTAAGCSAPLQTINITINPAPVTPPISGNNAVCAGQTGVNYSFTPTAGLNYVWSVSGGAIASGQGTPSMAVNWGSAGSGSVTLVATNASNCPGPPVTLSVTINAGPVTSVISGPPIVCAGAAGQPYSVTAAGGSNFNWIVNGGSVAGGQGTNSITINWGTPGTGTITVIQTSAAGCAGAPQVLPVNITTPPVAQITSAPANICFGQAITLNSNAGPGAIAWTTSGTGTFVGGNTATPSYLPGTNTGSVTLSLTVFNPPCPVAKDSVTLIIHPVPTINVTASKTNICVGDSSVITATGGGSYLWAPGGQTTASITAKPTTSTTYTVFVTNAFNCQSQDSIRITVNPFVSVNAGADVTVCSGVSVPLSGVINNATGLQWLTSGNGTFVPNNSTINAVYVPGTTDVANGSVNIILTSSSACNTASDTLVITILPAANVNAGPDQTVPPGQSVQLAGTATNPVGVTWSTLGSGAFSPSNGILTATYMPSSGDITAGSVLLVLASVNGCRDTMEVKFSEFFIPNIITPLPHTPGYNDFFVIKGLPERSKLVIFDRWGIMIFEDDNYQNNWDANGVSDDTYYYVLTLPDKKRHAGFVRVLRSQ